MIHYLLLYQFPFLYCVTIAMGLVVYGSDLDSVVGNLYYIPLLLLPVLHVVVTRLYRPLGSFAAATTVLLAGAVVALAAYQLLHFSYWDEHSLLQAIALALLGILSYLASVIASIRLVAWEGNQRRASAGAWLVLGLSWVPAYYYPMWSLFVMAVILVLASIWHIERRYDVEPVLYKKMTSRPVKYLVFLLMMDMGLVIWDYQVNTGWALHLGGVFVAAAVGCWYAYDAQNRHFRLIMIIATLNFVAAIVWPPFILHFMHSVLIGLPLGWGIGYLIYVQGDIKSLPVVSATMLVFLGFGLGYLGYSNLVHAQWRVLFLLPLLILLLIKYSWSGSAKLSTSR
jgi:hypothetical protein